jgi:hypothetical protein
VKAKTREEARDATRSTLRTVTLERNAALDGLRSLGAAFRELHSAARGVIFEIENEELEPFGATPISNHRLLALIRAIGAQS